MKINWENLEEEILFQKLLKREKKSFHELEKEKFADQKFGSIHKVDDSLVHFDDYERDDYKNALRPGVVLMPPEFFSLKQTKWAPMSSKINNRNKDEVLFLEKSKEEVKKDCVVLPLYSEYYTPDTLSKKMAELSDEKKKELAGLMDRIGGF